MDDKMGHWIGDPGSILNAYRDRDITFDDAVRELQETKKKAISEAYQSCAREYERRIGGHEPGCPTIVDDESDYEYLADAGECACMSFVKWCTCESQKAKHQ